MSGDATTSENPATYAVRRAMQAMRLACGDVPHLAGLAHAVRVKADGRIPVAGVSQSGLVLVNPQVFSESPLGDLAFVLAHEMLHLALDTHGRQGNAPHLIANYAHDYIINDILTEEMGRRPPLDGLYRFGARNKSFEETIVELSSGSDTSNLRCWGSGGASGGNVPRRGPPRPSTSPISRALSDAGLLPPDESSPSEMPQGDLISSEDEDKFEPDITPEQRAQRRERVRKAAVKAAALGAFKKKLGQAGPAQEPERGETMMRAVREAYHTPWELAMQRWFDAVAPGERTYSRPSRRGADRLDVVLPGRRREGWVLHIVLDTSGSMVDYLPKALGAIAGFCESSNVTQVHLLQCDVAVTQDDWVEPEQLDEYKIAGFGYSDMSPAMVRLAEDPEVSSIVVLTDGYIDMPSQEPPYQTLWVLLGEVRSDFTPAYGHVVQMQA
jgi:predicted metal-dependent peptidase